MRSTSHPFVAEPSQLPRPGAQVPITQVPVVQDSEANGMSQTVPHPPQSVSVLIEVSHPSASVELQSS